ncbi:MAG TPA: transglutaminase-like domain-containing protein [Ramlibacter sp.]|nr:transglutaminase-like domain-containing protein [Ramlibacter sp.]
MSLFTGKSRSWLAETELLDLSHPRLSLTVRKLVHSGQRPRERALTLHSFVRLIPYAVALDAQPLSASEALRHYRGDSVAKGTLFVALCRSAGLAARLQFMRMRSDHLQGILEHPPATVVHAVSQVLIDGQWLSTDGYVLDPVLFTRALARLAQDGRRAGWGLYRDATPAWTAQAHCLQQVDESDVIHAYGAFDDPAELCAQRLREGDHPGWMTRATHAVLGRQLLDRRIDQLRRAPSTQRRVQVD